MIFQTATKALIWHEDALLKGGNAAGLRATLATFRDHALPMAVVTLGDPDQMRGLLLRRDLSGFFSKDASKVAVFTAADQETTVYDHALTSAFAQAWKTLGTDRHASVALVQDCEQTRRARHAGLPVITYSDSERDVRERTIDHGARTAVSSPIDLESAVLQFRPFQEAKWHYLAAPVRDRYQPS